MGTVFLMTDAQVADEKFLVLVNDLLASGKLVPHEAIGAANSIASRSVLF